MNKKQWTGLAAGLMMMLGVSGVAKAVALDAATTLDFSSGSYSNPYDANNGGAWHSYSEQGFTFTTEQHFLDDLQPDGLGHALSNFETAPYTWIATLTYGGKAFNLLGFDYAGTGQITVGNGAANHGYDLGDDYNWHTAEDAFNNVTQISFTLAGSEETMNEFLFDNFKLQATATPEPATLLLLGSGLAGLIGARRRKTAQA